MQDLPTSIEWRVRRRSYIAGIGTIFLLLALVAAQIFLIIDSDPLPQNLFITDINFLDKIIYFLSINCCIFFAYLGLRVFLAGVFLSMDIEGIYFKGKFFVPWSNVQKLYISEKILDRYGKDVGFDSVFVFYEQPKNYKKMRHGFSWLYALSRRVKRQYQCTTFVRFLNFISTNYKSEEVLDYIMDYYSASTKTELDFEVVTDEALKNN